MICWHALAFDLLLYQATNNIRKVRILIKQLLHVKLAHTSMHYIGIYNYPETARKPLVKYTTCILIHFNCEILYTSFAS